MGTFEAEKFQKQLKSWGKLPRMVANKSICLAQFLTPYTPLFFHFHFQSFPRKWGTSGIQPVSVKASTPRCSAAPIRAYCSYIAHCSALSSSNCCIIRPGCCFFVRKQQLVVHNSVIYSNTAEYSCSTGCITRYSHRVENTGTTGHPFMSISFTHVH